MHAFFWIVHFVINLDLHSPYPQSRPAFKPLQTPNSAHET
jgi:hypothetical protein